MIFLVEEGAKLSYFMLFTLSLPIIINTPYVLSLWLGEYPKYSDVFIQLVLIVSMHETISSPLVTAMLATGKIKKYQIVVGSIQLLNLPLSYIALRLGYPPEIVFIIALFISIASLSARIYMLRGMIDLSVKSFIRNVYLKIISVSALSFIIPYMLIPYTSNGFRGFVTSSLICVTLSLTSIYFIGCNNKERAYIKNITKGIKRKIFR